MEKSSNEISPVVILVRHHCTKLTLGSCVRGSAP